MRDSTLMAQRFDPDRLELNGDAVPVAEQVQTGGATGRTGGFSVSQTSALVYQTGAGGQASQLKWYDRSGKEVATLGDMGDYGDVELSPDGSRVAVSLLDAAVRTRDVWIFDVKRGLRTRFTFEPGDEVAPIWSPDGSRLIFSARESGAFDLVQKPSTGSGRNEKVFANNANQFATSWSPDGRSILASATTTGSTDIWMLPLSSGAKAKPFVQTPAIEASGQFSPDGRWLAYSSNESGRAEVYVAASTGQAGKWQVSTAGGTFPRWRRDGKELFYLGPDSKLMAAEVRGQTSGFDVDAVRALFDVRPKLAVRYAYAVTADGQRFLVNSSDFASSPEPLTLLVNWTAALRR
jgi:Tol biopolymer transport system component